MGSSTARLVGKVAIVTGAGRGIGSGVVKALVNNAQSWGPPGANPVAPPATPFEDLPEEWWDHTFQTGVKATFYFCQAVFPHLRSRGGKIINFGSPSAVAGRPGMVDYGANKEAIRGLTKSLAREWGPYGINVNVICPVVETDALRQARQREPHRAEAALEVVPMRRLGDADRDAGPLAVFLASGDSDYLTGHTFMLDGGRVMI